VIKLGWRSLDRLQGVHPDLVRVVQRAALLAEPDQDFTVLEGLRSKEGMCTNWGKGRTADECIAHGVPALYARPAEKKVTWLSNPFASNHGAKADGYGHAVDLAPFPIDWGDLARFKALGALMLSAAHQEGVKIGWGGNWLKSKDWPHFELVA
jgi:peptidoglycan L-alanyl-D-glutamate endopeptidase CwlK